MPPSATHLRLSDVEPKPRWMTSWEKLKHKEAHWFVEMVAEMLGAFLLVYAGVGATAAFVVGSITGQVGMGSLYTIGFAYATGVTFAISLCAATSGGHFNPGITIMFVVFRGFPLRKAARYIFAQILGAYITCMIVYVQWKDLLVIAENILIEKGLYDTVMFSSSGPAGVFGFYVAPSVNLLRVLLNEFVTDFVIGLVVWGCLDPTNHMIPPSAAPILIGLAFGLAGWSYSPVGVATNTARDLGGRLAAMTIWGLNAVGGRYEYAAIAALGNIPATLCAALVYELFLGSTTRTLTPNHIHFLRAHKQYYEDNNLAPYGYLEGLNPQRNRSASLQSDLYEKSQTEVVEVFDNHV
ncbi:aquaporin-like protein [Rhizopogon vinicolor AM-OR11-026]|uniref:Aquaporin-like protein n=1 Tax=Rhizopogon vinicolor AM-OR11-026 TaxID=1314800 RepID=A0A1B7NE42_9AGAM|nr:aquaporin-like protein [Rhizopogon vinicolor AM-OR11-026]